MANAFDVSWYAKIRPHIGQLFAGIVGLGIFQGLFTASGRERLLDFHAAAGPVSFYFFIIAAIVLGAILDIAIMSNLQKREAILKLERRIAELETKKPPLQFRHAAILKFGAEWIPEVIRSGFSPTISAKGPNCPACKTPLVMRADSAKSVICPEPDCKRRIDFGDEFIKVKGDATAIARRLWENEEASFTPVNPEES